MVLLLNLLVVGGVGYLIMGQKTKGIVAIIAWCAGLFTCGIGSGIVSVFAAIDGYMQAQQLQAGHPVGEWTWFNDHR
jgi:choline-glycine betaine transporter